MAIRQKKLLTQGSGSWSGSFDENVLAGNAVVLLADAASSSGTINSTGATFHGSAVTNTKQLFSVLTPGGGSSPVYVTGWVMPNVPGGAEDVAVSMTGGGSFGAGVTGVWGLEIDDLGINPTVISPTDGAGSHHGTSTALDSTVSAPATAAGYAFSAQVAFASAVTPEGSPWTAVDVQMTDHYGSAAYRTVNEGDTVEYTGTAAASVNWVSAVAIVVPSVSLSVTTSSLPNGVEGSAYSQTLAATGGTSPYTWTKSAGSLPTGLSISSSGVISGTPTASGVFSFTAEVTDSASTTATASLSITIPSTPWPDLIFSGKTTSSGVDTWNVTTSINGTGGQTVRVLPPTSPAALPHAILLVLTADATDDDPTNNGFDLLNGLGAQNLYNFTIVESTYSVDPCHANHATDTTRQNETYDLELIKWALATYGESGDKVYAIGYSKSGLGGQALMFRNPTVISKVASWDFPAEIQDVAGTDPVASGGIWSSLATIMVTNYGSGSTGTTWFQANYELSPTNLAAWATADTTFTSRKRSWVGGNADFGPDVTWYKTTGLPGAGILADVSWNKSDSHAWHTDWMTDALKFLVGITSSFGQMAGVII
jgi:hypothetical protein